MAAVKRKSSDSQEKAEENELVNKAFSDSDFISSLIAALEGTGVARFAAVKKLQIIAKNDPSLIYPYFSVFEDLLNNSSSILLWNAIIILSYLAEVDTEKRFDAIFDKYYGHLRDGKLVTAANILANSGRIARCRPDLSERITEQLLLADKISLPTAECREVARRHVLSSFAEYVTDLNKNKPVYDFVVRCSKSHRAAIKKKAEEILRLN